MDAIDERTGIPAEGAGETAEEYRRVRELLLGGEQRQLTFLNHRLQEIQHLQKQLDLRCQGLHANETEIARRINTLVQRGDEFVERNLTAALERRAAGDEEHRRELARALQKPIEESLQLSLSENPDRLADTLNPAVNRGLWLAFQESGLQKLVRFRPDGSTKLAWPAAIFICTLLVALTGWLVYSIKENLRLDRAIEILSADPGVIVSVVENPVLGKPRIAGLRDPLAPAAADILQAEGISAEGFTLDLQPFQSVNTPYSGEREQDRVKELEAVRRQLIDTIAGLTTAGETIREQDLEAFTRALFASQVPDAAGDLKIDRKGDRWILSGEIAEPYYSQLLEQAPKLIRSGEIDTSGLKKKVTVSKFQKLSTEIEGVQLNYLPGKSELSEEGLRQSKRLLELIGEFEDEAEKLDLKPALLAAHALTEPDRDDLDEELEKSRIEAAEKLLKEEAGISDERILPGVLETGKQPGRAGVVVRFVEPEN